jgi:hypothetical protein
VVDSTDKPRNAADAPSRANPKGADGFAFIRRCRLLIGIEPNFVASASTEGKSVTLAAMRNAQTGSLVLSHAFQEAARASRTSAPDLKPLPLLPSGPDGVRDQSSRRCKREPP